MSLNACAALVEKADPMRFRAAMAAPVSARRVLFALYAFNVEVARAPWVTQEPMIAEMRLQWWRDALDEIAKGGPVRKHEVVDELAVILDADAAQMLDALVAARRWDVYTDAFEDQAHFDDYIDATSGNLMWVAARALGQAQETTVRDFAYASGVANWLRAVPDLEERGRKPLVDGTVAGVRDLAKTAQGKLQTAREVRQSVTQGARPALTSGYLARPVLSQAIKSPLLAAQGGLGFGPMRESVRFTNVAVRGWWV